MNITLVISPSSPIPPAPATVRQSSISIIFWVVLGVKSVVS